MASELGVILTTEPSPEIYFVGAKQPPSNPIFATPNAIISQPVMDLYVWHTYLLICQKDQENSGKYTIPTMDPSWRFFGGT